MKNLKSRNINAIRKSIKNAAEEHVLTYKNTDDPQRRQTSIEVRGDIILKGDPDGRLSTAVDEA